MTLDNSVMNYNLQDSLFPIKSNSTTDKPCYNTIKFAINLQLCGIYQ